MSEKDFNGFYEPYLRASGAKNILKNQLKCNRRWFNALYLLLFLNMAFFLVLLGTGYFNYLIIFMVAIASVLLFGFIEKRAIKNSVHQLDQQYQSKILITHLYDHFRYLLWKKELQEGYLNFSIKKTLNYLKIELKGLKAKQHIPPLTILILNGITFIAFWRILDDMSLTYETNLLLNLAIFYLSYRYISFKLMHSDKQKNLLLFEQFLLRLKSELEDKQEL